MLSPLLGIFIDNFGKRIYFLTLAFILYIISFLIFIFEPYCQETCIWSAIIPIIFLGFGFMFLSGTCWACLPLLV